MWYGFHLRAYKMIAFVFLSLWEIFIVLKLLELNTNMLEKVFGYVLQFMKLNLNILFYFNLLEHL